MKREELKHLIKYSLKNSYRKNINNLIKTSDFERLNLCEQEYEKNVLIIQRLNIMVGMFSDYIVFLHYIERAIERNMVPVIDRKTNKNYYLDADKSINTWELFFEQPCNLSLDDIDSTKHSISRCYTSDMCSVSLLNCKEKDVIDYWRKFSKKYIRLNANTKAHVIQWRKKLIDGKRILGVAIREGYNIWFQKTMTGKNHALQEDVKTVVKDVEKKLSEWNCNYVFLACQSVETEKLFESVFKDRLIIYPRKREMVDGLKAHSQRTKEQEYQNELDYITEMNLLASCTCFICSENSGAEAAFIMSNGFENHKCYSIGVN